MYHPNSGGFDLMMGGSWSFGHWLFFAVMATAILYPLGLILKRLGFSPFWSVLAFIPGVNIIALWVLALATRAPNNQETRP